MVQCTVKEQKLWIKLRRARGSATMQETIFQTAVRASVEAQQLLTQALEICNCTCSSGEGSTAATSPTATQPSNITAELLEESEQFRFLVCGGFSVFLVNVPIFVTLLVLFFPWRKLFTFLKGEGHKLVGPFLKLGGSAAGAMAFVAKMMPPWTKRVPQILGTCGTLDAGGLVTPLLVGGVVALSVASVYYIFVHRRFAMRTLGFNTMEFSSAIIGFKAQDPKPLRYSVDRSCAALSRLNEILPSDASDTRLLGTLSRTAKVNLSPEARRMARINERASEVAFAYPIDGVSEAKRAIALESPEVAFCAAGGFVYTNDQCEVVQTTALSNGDGLRFGEPQELPAELKEALARSLKPPTVAPIKELGVKWFAWIPPKEEYFNRHGTLIEFSKNGSRWKYGAFAYVFDDPNKPDCFFSIEDPKPGRGDSERQRSGPDSPTHSSLRMAGQVD
jgi:hypothetical protein